MSRQINRAFRTAAKATFMICQQKADQQKRRKKFSAFAIDDLRKSGLSIENAPWAEPVTSETEIKERLGFTTIDGQQIFKSAGYWIHFPGTDFFRLKLSRPIGDAKYLSPHGKSNVAFLLPDVKALATGYKPKRPILFVEGEKKAAAATLAGFPAIGLVGVFGFQGREERFLSDLVELNFSGRHTYIIYDSDITDKPQVRQAELRLAVELTNRGAEVFSVRLPSGVDGAKVGLDDYLVAHGVEKFQTLVDGAKQTLALHVEELTSTNVVLKEIAKLSSAIEREKVCKLISDREKVTVTAVKNDMKKYVPTEDSSSDEKLQGTALLFQEIEPWPEEVDGAELLNAFQAKLSAHVKMSESDYTICSLWALLSWSFDSFDILPMLAIQSPVMRCGKSTLLSVLSRLIKRPLPASNTTAAAIFRAIEELAPSLLVDEADSFVKDNEELRGLLNSGHTRGEAYVLRCVGKDFEPRTFSTWCPKVLSGIGKLQATIEDRSFLIKMSRLAKGETVQRLKHSEQWPELRRKAMRWANDNSKLLREISIEAPEFLNNRAADNFTTIMAIAKVAGGDWYAKAINAARATVQQETDPENVKIELLSDIRTLFEHTGSDRFSTVELLEKLYEIEERPWSTWRRGNPMTDRQLARLLRDFGVRSKVMRIGGVPCRGYDLASFEPVFAKYVPDTSVTVLQSNDDRGSSDSLSVTGEANVTDKKVRNPLISKECYAVTLKNPPEEEKSVAEKIQELFPGAEELKNAPTFNELILSDEGGCYGEDYPHLKN